MTSITLAGVRVDGINTLLRAQGIKHMILGGKKLGASLRIPILHDISLSVKPGERVGIIGGNGSGKSSLLKVIAGIYPPREGTAKVVGRIAPLIEMGVGFDPELTGRENIKVGLIYSGRFFDYSEELEREMIAFTELGENIDRPMKGYSSGMRARLCFAVSLFQQPDILLLDEVFATGDASFVEKARSSMAHKFSTVPIALLVTHSIDLISQFCNRCIWMESGRILEDGQPETVIAQYLKAASA
jgi:lipopolysaccharide transport system ATP-binding protein